MVWYKDTEPAGNRYKNSNAPADASSIDFSDSRERLWVGR